MPRVAAASLMGERPFAATTAPFNAIIRRYGLSGVFAPLTAVHNGVNARNKRLRRVPSSSCCSCCSAVVRTMVRPSKSMRLPISSKQAYSAICRVVASPPCRAPSPQTMRGCRELSAGVSDAPAAKPLRMACHACVSSARGCGAPADANARASSAVKSRNCAAHALRPRPAMRSVRPESMVLTALPASNQSAYSASMVFSEPGRPPAADANETSATGSSSAALRMAAARGIGLTARGDRTF